jgi:hypothetical protein
MASNGKQFKATLGAWALKAGDKLDALARQSALQLSEDVVKATPVDTGFLRGSWQPSIGAPAGGGGALDASGAAAQASVTLAVQGIKRGDRFFLINNARYAMRLEYGFVGQDSLGRTYNQTGRFFVGNAVKRWPRIVARVAQELKLS